MATEIKVKMVPDRWLAAHLKCDAYRFEAPRGCPLELLRSQLNDLRPGFYDAKLSTHDVHMLEELQRGGFAVVDVNVTFEQAGRDDIAPANNDCSIERYDADRHYGVAEIAQSCFVCSRFHLDPHIPDETANRIKRAWVENYIAGRRGDHLWIAQWQGATAGFLCEMQIEHDGATKQVIDLVGVDAANQGRGIGRELVMHVLREAGSRIVRVGTQVANTASIRLYERCGFRLTESMYVLHAHIGDGQTVKT